DLPASVSVTGAANAITTPPTHQKKRPWRPLLFPQSLHVFFWLPAFGHYPDEYSESAEDDESGVDVAVIETGLFSDGIEFCLFPVEDGVVAVLSVFRSELVSDEQAAHHLAPVPCFKRDVEVFGPCCVVDIQYEIDVSGVVSDDVVAVLTCFKFRHITVKQLFVLGEYGVDLLDVVDVFLVCPEVHLPVYRRDAVAVQCDFCTVLEADGARVSVQIRGELLDAG